MIDLDSETLRDYRREAESFMGKRSQLWLRFLPRNMLAAVVFLEEQPYSCTCWFNKWRRIFTSLQWPT